MITVYVTICVLYPECVKTIQQDIEINDIETCTNQS